MKVYEENNTPSTAEVKEERPSAPSEKGIDQMVETVNERGKGSWMAGGSAILPQTAVLQYTQVYSAVLVVCHKQSPVVFLPELQVVDVS